MSIAVAARATDMLRAVGGHVRTGVTSQVGRAGLGGAVCGAAIVGAIAFSRKKVLVEVSEPADVERPVTNSGNAEKVRNTIGLWAAVATIVDAINGG